MPTVKKVNFAQGQLHNPEAWVHGPVTLASSAKNAQKHVAVFKLFHISLTNGKNKLSPSIVFVVTVDRRKIGLTGVSAKFRNLDKFTCKGTLRQVFIRVYKLETYSQK
jgi:hypothetical protein